MMVTDNTTKYHPQHHALSPSYSDPGPSFQNPVNTTTNQTIGVRENLVVVTPPVSVEPATCHAVSSCVAKCCVLPHVIAAYRHRYYYCARPLHHATGVITVFGLPIGPPGYSSGDEH